MKEKILELLNDEIYDICDEFEPTSVADAVECILCRLKAKEVCNPACLGPVVTCELGSFTFKVSNKHRGFVSCSDNDNGCTGVSRTEYYPYYTDDDGSDDGLKNLIEMMNEAFYACIN